MDPSFSHCSFEEYKDNPLTKDYCAAKNEVSEFASTGFIMLGVFICIVTCMIAGSILAFAKRRHILAFGAQQIIPVATEAAEKVALTLGKVKASIVKEVAPAYGNVAKEISKGIKEGLKDDDGEEK